MKKLIYKNIISIIVFFLLPWFYMNNDYELKILSFDSNYLLILVLIGVIYLLYENTKSLLRFKGKQKVVPIVFILIPALILIYFILGIVAFSNYSVL